MQPAEILINQIKTNDLLYYDVDFSEICFRFCSERDIDCLPALGDPGKFYHKTKIGFTEENVEKDRRVDESLFIFEPFLLELFRTNPVLFVYQHNRLTGVVHFSDYNRPEVDVYLFSVLSAYEKALRRLLVLHEYTDQHMLNLFMTNSTEAKNVDARIIFENKMKDYERKRKQLGQLPPFEGFYLRDLIDFANKEKIISLRPDANDLRNMVMHSQEMVNKYDPSREDYIYNFESFEILFGKVQCLLTDFRKVSNKIALLDLLKS